ncbi:glycosyl hydrolase family 65 protein [Gryllotalpicola kribbensis]|uniref:Glycosyl hydrolase family 65 protein n=1 Tax=Gryllotalpicola kribbensis TaxID=993084 RepID=A0ABP8AHX0_9MICO
MSSRAPLTVEDWAVGVSGHEPAWAPQLESLFALSNGFLGWRGTLDEKPSSLGGTCRLNGFFERFPLAYAEPAYGYPKFGQALAGAPDGAVIALSIDGERLDLGAGTVHAHEQRLELRDGTLTRETVWESPAGARVRVRSTRLVSLCERGLAAVRFEVEALDGRHDATIVSLLEAADTPQQNEDGLESIAALVPSWSEADDAGGAASHATAHSGLAVAAAVHHDVGGGAEMRARADAAGIRTTITAALTPGRALTVTKLIGYATGADHQTTELVATARAQVETARRLGWAELLSRQRAVLDGFWRTADVEIDGDPRLQQAIRFALFHVFQSVVFADPFPPPAKGLTGSGYQGHTFWDLDSFVVPVLAVLRPEAAASALRWRHRGLPLAQQRARELGFRGAAFPWRTIDGHESSGYWPASTAALHLNADIADAVLRYVWATGDEEFAAREGVELLVQTARLWQSLVRTDDEGVAHLDGVTGPDEYSALGDDNLYTNLMAQQNLLAAAQFARRHREAAARLAITADELARWEATAHAIALPFDERKRVHAQSAGFTGKKRWPFDEMTADAYPLMEHHPYVQLYRHEVAKQADLALALVRRPGVFTAAQRERDFAYYEAITVRDSSLSAATQAVLAAELGHVDLAAEYVREVAQMDLADLHGDTQGGIHLAAAAGLWTALAAGFGGLRLGEGAPAFAPRLPERMHRLRFRARLCGRLLLVDIRPGQASYRVLEGPPLTVTHCGQALSVGQQSVTAPIPRLPRPGPPPTQPRHRPPGLDAPR